MPGYNAADIVGKTLIAGTWVPLKRLPFDAAPDIYQVRPDQSVGVVYSYLLPNNDRKKLYWTFYDTAGKAYYAEHLPGRFSVQGLTEQGVKTTLQKIEEQAKKDESVKSTIERNVKWLAVAAGVIILAKAFIMKKVK